MFEYNSVTVAQNVSTSLEERKGEGEGEEREGEGEREEREGEGDIHVNNIDKTYIHVHLNYCTCVNN